MTKFEVISVWFYQFQKVLNFDSAGLDFKRLFYRNPTCKANPIAFGISLILILGFIPGFHELQGVQKDSSSLLLWNKSIK